jgi:nucleoside-diphosphate-sugar epimerase
MRRLIAEKTNVLGMRNICAAAQKAGVKHLINISTIFTLLDEVPVLFQLCPDQKTG